MTDDNWKFIGGGCWINETINARVILNEDYKNTYRAFKDVRGVWQDVYCNKNGNPIRFRSREAAIKHVEKQKV